MIDINDCWLWAGRVNRLDYGRYAIKIDGKWRERPAHRLMYENLVGEIPEGLVLDHLCRVTRCVNPDHLEPVTVGENVLRGDGVRVQSSKTHCPNGHPYSEANIRLIKQGKYIVRTCRTCINAYRRRGRAAGKNV